MSGDEAGATGITQRELLPEMREDVRGLKAAVEAIARDQALSVERRASMQRVADAIAARLDSQEQATHDLQRWRDEAAGAIRLARWALGSGLAAPDLMVLQSAAIVSRAASPAVLARRTSAAAACAHGFALADRGSR